MTGPDVRLEVEAAVATITLDRPGRKNALDLGAVRQLTAALLAVDGDPAVRVAVLTGANGDFCAGADLGALDRDVPPLQRMNEVNRAAETLQRVRVPVVARVDGDAVGMGMNLALACDLVVASERSRFSQIFSRRGLSVDFGGSWLLPRMVGLHRAKELCLLGEVLTAGQMAELGLLNHVVPVEALDAEVHDLTARLAAGPPQALALTKQLLNASSTSSFAQALANEGSAQSLNLLGADAEEAVAAFREKRTPQFTGA